MFPEADEDLEKRRRSTFPGNSVLQCCPLRDFEKKQFNCLMSCDLEVANERARFGEIILAIAMFY